MPKYDSKKIYKDIKKFYDDSLAKKYYAPFMMDSKNSLIFQKKLNCGVI